MHHLEKSTVARRRPVWPYEGLKQPPKQTQTAPKSPQILSNKSKCLILLSLYAESNVRQCDGLRGQPLVLLAFPGPPGLPSGYSLGCLSITLLYILSELAEQDLLH